MHEFAVLGLYAGIGFLATAAVFGVAFLRTSNEHHQTFMRWSAWAGILSIMAAFALVAFQGNVLPPRNRSESVLVITTALIGVCLLADAFFRLPAIPVVMLLACLPFMVMAVRAAQLADPTGSRINNPVIAVHVALTLCAYAFFGFSFVNALLYVVVERQLKSRRPRAWLQNLPSLEITERLNLAGIFTGGVLLTFGMVLGYLVQRADPEAINEVAWRLSPTVIRTTIVWAVYAGLSALAGFPSIRGRRIAYYSLFAFLVLLGSFYVDATVSDFHT